MAKSLKFTIEVNGIELSDRAQAEISKALNETFLQKLGEVDMTSASKDAKAGGDAKAAGALIAAKYLPNGGWIDKLMNPKLTTAIQQFQRDLNVPAVEGKLAIVQM